MPGRNRHRPPTIEQMFNRIYRQQLEVKANVASIKEHGILVAVLLEQLAARTQLTEILAAHVARLLLEKQTLMQLVEANRDMAAALPRRESIPVLTEEAG